MSKFEQCYHRDGYLIVSGLEYDVLQQLPGVLALTLSGDGSRRVED
jgi:hypothetical protein